MFHAAWDNGNGLTYVLDIFGSDLVNGLWLWAGLLWFSDDLDLGLDGNLLDLRLGLFLVNMAVNGALLGVMLAKSSIFIVSRCVRQWDCAILDWELG